MTCCSGGGGNPFIKAWASMTTTSICRNAIYRYADFVSPCAIWDAGCKKFSKEERMAISSRSCTMNTGREDGSSSGHPSGELARG